MKRLACILVVAGVVGMAGADWYTAYVNDFSTLDGVSVRCGEWPIACCENLRLEDGGAVADVTSTGYALMDIDLDPDNGINTDSPIDFSYGEFDITLEWYGEWWIPDEVTCFWIRVLSRTWDEDAGEWAYGGRLSFGCFDVLQEETGPNWQMFTRDVQDWNEADAGFDPTQVYNIRVDSVVWDEGLIPYSFGIDHFELRVPECPDDITGDDDVDLEDLALLLSEYGCNSVDIMPGFSTYGFEAYDYGDLPGQDGFQDMSYDDDPNDSLVVMPPQVIDDPTGSGMGKVVVMDPPHDPNFPDPNYYEYTGWTGFYRPYDDPPISGLFSIAWDQYRPDGGDNVWISDDPLWDGWWSIEWDSSGAGSISTYEWQEFIALTFNVWQHVQYKYDLDNDIVVLIVDDVVKQVSYGDPDGIEGLYMDITDTFVEGDGPIYIDNLEMGTLDSWECPIDYNGDGKTNLGDLAQLLGSYGCGVP